MPNQVSQALGHEQITGLDGPDGNMDSYHRRGALVPLAALAFERVWHEQDPHWDQYYLAATAVTSSGDVRVTGTQPQPDMLQAVGGTAMPQEAPVLQQIQGI